MSYHGNEPSKVAVSVGQGVIDASHIQDASITTLDLANDAITANQIDDDGTGFQVGSLGIGTSVTGIEKLTVGGTASFSGAITGDLTGDVTGDVSGSSATVTGATQSAITSLGTLTALTVDDITLNGSTISDSSDLTLDMGGDIILDAGGSDILLKVAGTTFGSLRENSSNFRIKSEVSDKDIVFMGNDGGSEITALTLDMSEAGKAIFTGQCQASSFITGDLILKSPVNNGHYTIWEEEEYLAIRNELTGKKYKFVLEEIE